MKQNKCENKSDSKIEYSEEEKEQALEFLKSPDLIKRFLDVCHTQYLGRDKELLLIKLATISRRMRRGVSVIITGTSSVGKSELLNTVLKTVDSDDLCNFTGVTPQYLLYRSEPLEHKVVMFFEITGANEIFHLLRTAISEGHLNVGTVTNGKQGLHSEDLRKSSEGLVMMTTFASGKVDGELDTRIIIIEIDHDENLAKKVLKLKAENVKSNDQDFKIWQIADNLIEPLDVVIPYADQLAELFPVKEERFMRDFEKLLTLIKSSALWHQYQREKDDNGSVIASKQDYENIYSLRDMISQTVSSLSEPVKQFLLAIKSSTKKDGEWIDKENLKKDLGVSKSTINRHIKTSVESDFIETSGRGKKQKLKLIEMPDMISPLPEPEKIFGYLCEPMSQNEEEHVNMD